MGGLIGLSEKRAKNVINLSTFLVFRDYLDKLDFLKKC